MSITGSVSATDKATGKTQKIEIKDSSGLEKDEIETMKRDAESHAEEDKSRRELVDLKNRAEMMSHQTKKSLEEHGDKISSEVRSSIESAMSNLDEKLKEDDKEAIEAALSQLGTAAEELGKAIYEATAAETTSDSSDDSADSNNDDDVIDAEYEVKED